MTSSDRNHPLRICFIADHDVTNPHFWSGTPRFMDQSLQRDGVTTRSISLRPVQKLANIANRLTKMITGRSAYSEKARWLARCKGWYASCRLFFSGCDVAIIVISAPTAAYIITRKPVYYITDGTYPIISRHYHSYDNYPAWVKRNSLYFETRLYQRITGCFISSSWAADLAVEECGAEQGRVHVIPLGANLTQDVIASCKRLPKQRSDTITLLFVSADWKRKGGNTVLRIAELLIERGLSVELLLVGKHDHVDLSAYPYVKDIGWLSKHNHEDVRRLAQLFQDAHFFVMPTEAEAFGVVFCEASAFGTPSLAYRVGGIPNAVQDGKNGYLIDPNQGAEAFADRIEQLWTGSKEDYDALCTSTRHYYEQRLNWNAWGDTVLSVINKTMNRL